MRVALVAPLVAAIDDASPQLGGVQSVVSDLAHGLVALGHDVTLFAPRGSRVAGVRVVDLGLEARDFAPAVLHRAAPRADTEKQRAAFARIAGALGGFDVVHAHAYDGPAFDALQGRVVHTLHLPPIDPTVVDAARRTDATLVTVSRANAAAWRAAGVNVTRWIWNGIDVSRVPFGTGEGGFLLVAGRIAPEKGVDAAARIAERTTMPLRVVGDVYGSHPSVSSDGPVPRAELFRIMGEARALLMPVTWDEPFGLVAVEAMAAGTPVIAYRRGGLGEVVADGATGLLVTAGDEDALADAVRRVGSIDRRACRARVEQLFTLECMARDHVDLYRNVM